MRITSSSPQSGEYTDELAVPLVSGVLVYSRHISYVRTKVESYLTEASLIHETALERPGYVLCFQTCDL